MNNYTFEIILETPFKEIDTNKLSFADNKKVLGLANDFENEQWRYSKFKNYIWDNIAQTALSQEERDNLIDKSYSSLVKSAQNLSVSKGVGRGSELCEILLYGIMKEYYQALSVVPKIFHKQNSQNNATGVDSVHIVIENNTFSLWFGEAKFYTNIEPAFNSAVNSIHNFLSNGEKIRKENSFITDYKDIQKLDIEEQVKTNILNFLHKNPSLDEIRPRMHIPILILYQCDLTKAEKDFNEQYKQKIRNFYKQKANNYFKKQIKKLSTIYQYEKITFHLILFPVPDKNKIVDSFTKTAKLYKDNE